MARFISICIPCYRDLAGARATISSVLAALAETPSIQCEFVVGLNHCDFGEADLLAPFCDIGCHTFSIGTNDGYLEYDDSLIFTISHASQDVCLLMGCGDIAQPGLGLAIEKFLDDELNMGVLLVDHEAACFSLETRIGNWQSTDSGFFNKVLSGHLFDGKVLRETVRDPLIGFEWGHVELAIRGAALAGGTTSVMSQPVIWRNAHSTGWWMRSDIIKQYVEYCSLIESYHERYPELAFPAAEVRKSGGVRLLLTILQARSNGFRELPLFLILWQEKYKVRKLVRMLIRVAFVLPQPIVQKLYGLLTLAIRLRR